jgi:predicted GIY-YIG superfamily endonuclease
MPSMNPTPTPKPQVRVAPLQSKSEAAKQEKALKELQKKREAVAKKTGIWPNYGTN